MKAKTVTIDGKSVNYYESVGTGSNVILVHGNSGSAKTFKKQLDSDFGQKYHVFAMDLPGHGDTAWADKVATYSMPGYAKVLAEFAKELGIDDAVLVGWSLGGHIVLEAHNLLPKAKGFAIYGTPPLSFPPDMESAYKPNPAVNVGFMAKVSAEQAKQYASSFFAEGSNEDLAAFVEDILKTDGAAREGLFASIVPDGYQNEVKIVAELDRPLLIMHGEGEQLVNSDYIANLDTPTLFENEIKFISNAGHAPHWENSEDFNAILDSFITEACS